MRRVDRKSVAVSFQSFVRNLRPNQVALFRVDGAEFIRVTRTGPHSDSYTIVDAGWRGKDWEHRCCRRTAEVRVALALELYSGVSGCFLQLSASVCLFAAIVNIY